MFNIGDYVVYKRDVCKIKNIKENYIKNKDYYVLNPINYESLIIHVPKDNNDLLRTLITREAIENIIKEIPKIPVIESNDKLLEN